MKHRIYEDKGVSGNPKEAEVVRDTFAGFVDQSAVTALIKDLADRGIKTKR